MLASNSYSFAIRTSSRLEQRVATVRRSSWRRFLLFNLFYSGMVDPAARADAAYARRDG
jgi:hypothetical protein